MITKIKKELGTSLKYIYCVLGLERHVTTRSSPTSVILSWMLQTLSAYLFVYILEKSKFLMIMYYNFWTVQPIHTPQWSRKNLKSLIFFYTTNNWKPFCNPATQNIVWPQ